MENNTRNGFEDEGTRVHYSGPAIGGLSRICKANRKQRVLDMIYGSTPEQNDAYAIKYRNMSKEERELEDKRVNELLNED